MPKPTWWTPLVALFCPCTFLLAAERLGDADHQARLVYERHVRPILKAHCFHCHGEEQEHEAALDLRLVRSMLSGGDSGPAIQPGSHGHSLLWQRIDAEEMPPGEDKLSRQQRATIAAWIDQGAHTARPEPESLADGPNWTEEEQSFWSFQPIRRRQPPQVKRGDLVRTPVDAWLLARLEAAGLSFSPEADKQTLIRRASFDLTGLPPTLDEVDRFLADNADGAYERMIERLLASPHYGERWARHWLDVAGYADSDGYTPLDPERPYAYKYRDYMIRALNADRPWDELIREQLAGDELLTPPYANLSPGETDKLVATGFLRMCPDGTADSSADQNVARNDVVAETIKIVSTSLLGLSVGCAQCHAHRYDPISHVDYHRLRAIFEPAYDWKSWRPPKDRLVSLWTDAQRRLAAEVDAEVAHLNEARQAELEQLVAQVFQKELAAAPEDLRDNLRQAQATPAARRTPEQQKLLKDHPRLNVTTGNVRLYESKPTAAILDKYARLVEQARAKRPPEDYVHCLTEVPGKVPQTFLFYRGDIQQPRQSVLPGELSVLDASGRPAAIPIDDPDLSTSGRRLAYARHLTSGRHPLVARVLVNRVWMHHFGRGIVSTPADFGALGDKPSHPELLDWLADEFMRSGWRLKHLHKLLMTSTAYRQSARRSDQHATDPDNRLLARMPVRRLEAESLRDAILAASGRLSPRMFGPPVPVTPDEVGQVVVGVDTRDTAGRPTGRKVDLGEQLYRRSIYVQVRRSLPLGMLEAFDAPALVPNCQLRNNSTVAPQSLLLMNNDFVVTEAEAFARRVRQASDDDPADQVRLAWRLALTTAPSQQQVRNAMSFIAAQRRVLAPPPDKPSAGSDADAPRDPDLGALACFCQALLSSNAFLYVD